MKKRLMILLLCICLCMTILPMTVLATEIWVKVSSVTFQVGVNKASGEVAVNNGTTGLTYDGTLPDGISSRTYGIAGIEFYGAATPEGIGSSPFLITIKDSDSTGSTVTITVAKGPQTIHVDDGTSTDVSAITIPLGADYTLNTYSLDASNNKINIATDYPSLTAAEHQPTYTYTSSNTAVATIDSTTGVVIPVAKGTTNIAINSDATNSYEAAVEKIITLTVASHSVTNSLAHVASNGASAVAPNTDYTATLTADSGYTLPAAITVTVDSTTLTAGDNTYSYDSTSGELTVKAAAITDDITITAAGVANRHGIIYQITGSYFANNSFATLSDIEYGTTLLLISDDMSKAGYTFSGWSGLPATMPDSDVTVTGSYTRNQQPSSGDSTDYYTLTFDTNGGSSISSIRPSEYTTVDLSKYTPTRTSYTFTGWYSDKELTTKITSVRLTKNTTIYAGWKLTHENPQTGVWDNPFTDVLERDWFYEDVALVNLLGLMQGTSDTTFSPYATTTRGMIVSILLRLENEPAVTAVNPFTDVASGKYYHDAVLWAAENNIVGGYGGGLFGPENAITREQLATILYNYAKYKDYDVSVGEDTNILSYHDVAEVSEWAIPAMQWACGAGLIQGDGGNLLPKDGASRAQMAAILIRFLNAVDV